MNTVDWRSQFWKKAKAKTLDEKHPRRPQDVKKPRKIWIKIEYTAKAQHSWGLGLAELGKIIMIRDISLGTLISPPLANADTAQRQLVLVFSYVWGFDFDNLAGYLPIYLY